jgi:hypothetical protein
MRTLPHSLVATLRPYHRLGQTGPPSRDGRRSTFLDLNLHDAGWLDRLRLFAPGSGRHWLPFVFGPAFAIARMPRV